LLKNLSLKSFSNCGYSLTIAIIIAIFKVFNPFISRTGKGVQMKQISIAEAKNRLPAIIRDVEKGPVIQLTRHGKPVAFLISAQEYETLTGRRGSLKTSLITFRNYLSKTEIELTEADFEGLRDPSTGREVELGK
jgi:prevent-host-death family protein